VGWDSRVNIATCCELDGPGIDSWWWPDFPHLSRPAVRFTRSHVQWVPGLFPRSKAAGAWHWLPPLPPPNLAQTLRKSSGKYFSRSVPSWPVLEWTVPLLLTTVRKGMGLVCCNKEMWNLYCCNWKQQGTSIWQCILYSVFLTFLGFIHCLILW
jgi:hypothetical protein